MNSTEKVIADTLLHQESVNQNIKMLVKMLSDRGKYHDASKLQSPELECFAENTEILSKLEYGTDAYKEQLEKIAPTIEHHYSKNRHHTEHFENGINDMNLVDIIEMVADWISACKRTKNGNIHQSLKINKERYGISDQTYQIIKNTVALFDV